MNEMLFIYLFLCKWNASNSACNSSTLPLPLAWNEYGNTFLKLTWLRYLIVFVIAYVRRTARVFAFLFPFSDRDAICIAAFLAAFVACSLFTKIIPSYIINLNIAWICWCPLWMCKHKLVIRANTLHRSCLAFSPALSQSPARSLALKHTHVALRTTYSHIPYSVRGASYTQGQHSY